MLNPWVPPYFGSWDRVVAYAINSALNPNTPILYKVREDGPEEAAARSGFHLPVPVPWMPAVPALVAAVNAQQLAATVEGSLRTQLEQSASASLAQVLDDYCGTPPRLIPWPFPGPPPWIFAIASELSAIANTSEAAGMRDDLLQVAGQVLQRAFGQAASSRR